MLRYLAAHDVGRAINPMSVEGQIAGAAVQGIGQALLEDVVVQDGVNLTGGFFQYLIPTATDVPDIESLILESGEGLGPFGARGIGEPPIGPPLAAITSAIADAVGRAPVRAAGDARAGARRGAPRRARVGDPRDALADHSGPVVNRPRSSRVAGTG